MKFSSYSKDKKLCVHVKGLLDDRVFETCGATVSQISCQQFDLLDLVDLVDLLDVVDWVDKRSVGRGF